MISRRSATWYANFGFISPSFVLCTGKLHFDNISQHLLLVGCLSGSCPLHECNFRNVGTAIRETPQPLSCFEHDASLQLLVAVTLRMSAPVADDTVGRLARQRRVHGIGEDFSPAPVPDIDDSVFGTDVSGV